MRTQHFEEAFISIVCWRLLTTCLTLAAATPATQVNEIKIVNGTIAQQDEFPFMVSLRRSSGNTSSSIKNPQHFCAGTILHPSWILTAAHCLRFIQRPSELIVQFGSTQLKPQLPQLAKVAKICQHEGYNPTIAVHDLALLKLTKSLKFDRQVNAVELGQMLPASMNVKLVGWGLNATNGILQGQLQQNALKLVTLNVCRKQLNAFLHKSNLCAGAAYKGQCSGDSGGPLLLNDNSQIGIVSWSIKPCGTLPGVFTNVGYYREWIQSKMQEESG